MILDRAPRRHVQHLFGHDERHVGHHAQIGFEPAELLPHLGLVLERARLEHRKLSRERGLFQRIDPSALSRIRRAIHADHVFTALEQRLEHALAKRLLPMDDDTHGSFPRERSGWECYLMWARPST
jgi:hypothetical protein